MELQQIKYFKMIAQTQNISTAAKKLYIAQPSLSQTLKRLENEVGTPLFDRVGKRIVLNDAGHIFLKYVDAILSSLENAERELSTYKSDTMTNVCICAQSASLLLPEIVVRIQSEYPNIHLQLTQQTDISNIIWDMKIYSSCDVPDDDHTVLLLEEPLGIVMPENHLLANKSVITKEDIKSESFVSLSDRHNLQVESMHYCESYGFEPTITTYLDSPNVMRDLLKINMGVAFIPQYTWKYFYEDGLVFKLVEDMPMKRNMLLTWDESRYMTPSAERCKNIIINFFKEYEKQFH